LKYEQQQNSLQIQISHIKSKGSVEIQATLARFARYRKQLEDDELVQGNKNVKDAEKAELDSKLLQEQLKQDFIRMKHQIDKQCSALDTRLSGMQQELFKDRLTLCQSQREVVRYEAVSFKNYVKRIVALQR
jgi:hypothetical protein